MIALKIFHRKAIFLIIKLITKMFINNRELILRCYKELLFGDLKIKVYGFFEIGNIRNLIIGENCRINSDVFIQAQNQVIIGNEVTISPGVKILDSGYNVESLIRDKRKEHINSFVKIGDNVWIGSNAIILPGVEIGSNSIIAAGSVVTKNVDAYSLMAGIPARKVKSLSFMATST